MSADSCEPTIAVTCTNALSSYSDMTPRTGTFAHKLIQLRAMDTPPRESVTVEGDQNSLITKYSIPIVGYEIMEERARFTVYKLRIENKITRDCWFVFRRYTDFVWLFSKLKNDFPLIKLFLPRKRWFGDNFDSCFLEERINGLQTFINSILECELLCSYSSVRDFFCLNEPPSYSDNVEESRALFEALEETIFHLRYQLHEKELSLENLKAALESETRKKKDLSDFINISTKDCTKCCKEFNKWTNPTILTSTPLKAEEKIKEPDVSHPFQSQVKDVDQKGDN
uniref:PX domain-containing protein n=1 Tax=Timema poppense TaxID=170557 RepID=A0A7R9DMC4_TIMPO|nr:unnamed protein product [Timema poppensis]